MQTRNKVFDDISQLMTNAMGVAQGAKDEAETAMKSWMDRWLADRDFVRDWRGVLLFYQSRDSPADRPQAAPNHGAGARNAARPAILPPDTHG